MSNLEPLEQLRIADPETYVRVKDRVVLMVPPPAPAQLKRLADEVIWALSQEPGLGRAMTDGLLQLMAVASGDRLPVYIRLVRQAAQNGPTLARLLAIHLVQVLPGGESLLAHFMSTLAAMRSKGTYTLSEPLEVLSELLQSGDRPSAEAYLDLLTATFEQTISYNHSVRLVYLIPKAVRGFISRRRTAQIEAFIRVVRTDLQWVDPFLAGMQKGLALLAPGDLEKFLEQALLRRRRNAAAGGAFISLSSEEGQKACADLQVAVPLVQVKGTLDRYLNARLGCAVTVKPMPAVPIAPPETPGICSDGQLIYLPEELDHYPVRDRNRRLAKDLVRLEAGFFEYGTFTLDLERAADLYADVARRVGGRATAVAQDERCEAERLFAFFDLPELAEDLFNLYEQARLMRHMAHDYPGLVQQALPVLQGEVAKMQNARQWDHALAPLYSRLVLGTHADAPTGRSAILVREAAHRFDALAAVLNSVETSAQMVCLTYDDFAAALAASAGQYRRLIAPFGRRLRWELVRAAFHRLARPATGIKIHLAGHGLKIYRADLQNKLVEQNGRLSTDDIKALVLSADAQPGPAAGQVDLAAIDFTALFAEAGIHSHGAVDFEGMAFYYPEWDEQVRDYLRNHVRVQESVVPAGDDDFYHSTLTQYRGLVARIRRAFEFLKPEGLAMLRQWPEGDDFDYRALIDFAVDLRAGRVPSDRLYVKRLKQERDVAALLLMDLSRSTANPVIGGHQTVLMVAKQALVLFCQALQVVGDTYAIAGFSGTGRHSVDYFRIKDFEEPLAPTVQRRISALRPQRSTRMGAAIRHAAAQLAGVSSRVRLLIVVSDGFPNDLGYKGGYAIADTRRAILEARARNVHVKAITVNIGSDPRLDDLYGRFHHHVIADVRELPDKLLRLYGRLTRTL